MENVAGMVVEEKEEDGDVDVTSVDDTISSHMSGSEDDSDDSDRGRFIVTSLFCCYRVRVSGYYSMYGYFF